MHNNYIIILKGLQIKSSGPMMPKPRNLILFLSFLAFICEITIVNGSEAVFSSQIANG